MTTNSTYFNGSIRYPDQGEDEGEILSEVRNGLITYFNVLTLFATYLYLQPISSDKSVVKMPSLYKTQMSYLVENYL